MAVSLDHAKMVLAGVIPERKDNLLYMLQHLQHEHFRQASFKTVFKAIDNYYDRTAGIIPKHVFTDWLERSHVEPARVLQYEELYADIESYEISDHEFRYAVEGLKDVRAKQLTGEAITTAFEVLERGAEVEGVLEEGHQKAREFIYEQFALIDQLDNTENAPEGDMRHEAAEIMQEYLDRKNGVTGEGILTGIQTVDEVTGGFQPGELVLMTAFTGQGKSQMSTQTSWHASVKQGKNVFFATTETSRTTVRRRLLARHSREPQFDLPEGLNSKLLKNGALDEEGERVFQEVLHDLETNPNYGKIHIAQIPQSATVPFIASRMARAQQLWNIDLCVIDYLALLRSDRRRDGEREEFNEIIRSAKTLSTSFNEGKGVPILSPWQLKREAYNEAQRSGVYGLSSLSDTSEAEKTPDVIMAMLRMDDTPKEVTMQFLKNRDGEIPQPFTLEVDYRTSYLADKGGGGEFDLSGFGLD
jgi:replicative DNA helicase